MTNSVLLSGTGSGVPADSKKKSDGTAHILNTWQLISCSFKDVANILQWFIPGGRGVPKDFPPPPQEPEAGSNL